ncbi:alpha-galactosidase, partial [candidate division KSB1 bacterium]|nr:alpha-galactosidase [candidate division KSB1 bacterium]
MKNEYKHVFGNNFVIVDPAKGCLNFYNQAEEIYYSFRIDPWIAYEQDNGQKGTLNLFRRSENAYIFKSEDKRMTKKIHLEIKENHIDYWVEVKVLVGEMAINTVHYGQETLDQASASAHKFSEFFIMCPDRYGTRIPKMAQVSFKLGIPSFLFTKDNNFPHEGGRTIISPYVTALKTEGHWLGVGTLEIPDSQWGLNMTFENGRAVTDFYYGGSLRIKSSYSLPKISFFEGSDKLSTCKSYIRRLYESGLARHNQQWDASWAGPIYCFFSDQMYEYQTDRTTPDMEGEMTMTQNYCNENFLKTCLDFLIEKSINYKIIIMDYGWFVNNGDWTPNTQRFKDLKATIKQLQSMGKKVLLWYSPYFLAGNTPTYQNNPDIVVNKKEGGKFFIMRFRTEKYYQSDYTHPGMREAALKDIQFLLSPEGLDADGIKVDCTHQPPLIDNVFHDPSWGLGER